MAVTDWIWALPCMLSMLVLTSWTWYAAGDVRDLEAAPDHQLLRAIATHQRRPALSLSPEQRMQRTGNHDWQLQR